MKEYLKLEGLEVGLNFLGSATKKFIPNKVKRYLERLSKIKFNKISSDKEEAIEYCLLWLSNISNSYYITEDFLDYKILNTKILRAQLGKVNNKWIDIAVRNLLTNERIIDIKNDYKVGEYSRAYRLTLPYYNKGVTLYEFTTQGVVKKLQKRHLDDIYKAINNSIAKSVLDSYRQVKLPTEEYLIATAKKLIKQGYKTNKGKELKFIGKHSRDEYDNKKYSFVEDNIKAFKNLCIENGFTIPSIGDARSGGRVVSSFTLLPAWIRNEITIDGEKLVQNDYSTLHPNLILQSLYGEGNPVINHSDVANHLGISRDEVKKEHLSFFNCEIPQMVNSKVYQFYEDYFYDEIQEVIKVKKLKGHSYISRQLFELEVQLMTRVVKKMNKFDIVGIYVYDCMYTKKCDQKKISEIMVGVAKKFGINLEVG